MSNPGRRSFVRFVLFGNGVADLFAASALFFPVLGIPLPGYGPYTREIAFVAGGWGVAALSFGIGRIWASFKPEFHRVMLTLGVLEGTILTAFCLGNVLFLGLSWLQVMLVLLVSAPFGVLSLVALMSIRRLNP